MKFETLNKLWWFKHSTKIRKVKYQLCKLSIQIIGDQINVTGFYYRYIRSSLFMNSSFLVQCILNKCSSSLMTTLQTNVDYEHSFLSQKHHPSTVGGLQSVQQGAGRGRDESFNLFEGGHPPHPAAVWQRPRGPENRHRVRLQKENPWVWESQGRAGMAEEKRKWKQSSSIKSVSMV